MIPGTDTPPEALDLKDKDVIKYFGKYIETNLRQGSMRRGNLAAKIGISEKQLSRYIDAKVGSIPVTTLQDILGGLSRQYQDFVEYLDKIKNTPQTSQTTQNVNGDNAIVIGTIENLEINR